MKALFFFCTRGFHMVPAAEYSVRARAWNQVMTGAKWLGYTRNNLTISQLNELGVDPYRTVNWYLEFREGGGKSTCPYPSWPARRVIHLLTQSSWKSKFRNVNSRRGFNRFPTSNSALLPLSIRNVSLDQATRLESFMINSASGLCSSFRIK